MTADTFAILCRVRTLGFLLVPRRILSTVDCFNPASVASLFMVIFRFLHNSRMRNA